MLAACGGTGTSEPAATDGRSVAGSRRRRRLHGRRVLEQLPAAALGGERRAEHAGRPIEAGGGTFIDADANLDTEQQLTDIETLINQGADVLIILAQDNQAVLPALEEAKDAGIPVIALRPADRGSERPLHHVRQRRRRQGRGRGDARGGARGQLRPDQGRPGRPERLDLPAAGLGPRPASRTRSTPATITIVDEQFTDAWETETAQNNMEAIIDAANAEGDQIDAVLAENDSTALRRRAALAGQELRHRSRSAARTATPPTSTTWPRASSTSTSGRTPTSSARPPGPRRSSCATGTAMAELTIPDGLIDQAVAPEAGLTAAPFTTPVRTASRTRATRTRHVVHPPAATRSRRRTWTCRSTRAGSTQEELCEGVEAGHGAAACQ